LIVKDKRYTIKEKLSNKNIVKIWKIYIKDERLKKKKKKKKTKKKKKKINKKG